MKFGLVAIVLITHSYAFSQRLIVPLRNKENATFPGAYSVTASMNKTEVNRGDSVSVRVFLSGYGRIRNSKIFVTASSNDFFDDKIRIKYNLTQTEAGSLVWGLESVDFTGFPIVMTTGSMSTPNSDTTLFADLNHLPQSLNLITEYQATNAPYTLLFKIRSGANPNIYNLKFYFTYFNGQEWQYSSETLEFRINNPFQEHETAFQIVLAIAALIGIIPGIETITRFFQKKKEVPPIKVEVLTTERKEPPSIY